MTSVLSNTTDLTNAVAAAVRERLSLVGDITVTVTRDVVDADGPGSAIVVGLGGSRPGELTLALYDAPLLGMGETTRSLGQRIAVEAASEAGLQPDDSVQVVEPRLAVNALLADPATSIAVLTVRGMTAAVVALQFADPTSSTRTGRDHPRLNPERLHLLRGVEMAVTAEIGRTRMTVGELLNLAEGAVIELDRPAGAPADLLVNGRLIARGEVVVVDEHFALRITDIVTADEER